jgi:transposase
VRCSSHGTRGPDQPATGQAGAVAATGIKSGRPPKWSKRQLIDGIGWRTRTGAPWRDVPARYGPWQTVYGLVRRWQRDGTWRQILTALQAQADAKGVITWDVSVDPTVVRAHQHAAGARKGGSATPRTGRSRQRAGRPCARPLPGGLSGKLHLAVEQARSPCRSCSPPASVATAPFAAVPGGIRVPRLGPGRPRTRPDRVLADKAYSSRVNRALLRCRGIRAVTPRKTTSRPPAGPGPTRWPPPGLRPGDLPAAPCGGVRHQPAQAAPGGGHPLRHSVDDAARRVDSSV